ncbi:hypothetical protein HYC85_000809 [Camellia sinensis]|uniref:Uncharacterized protein n=1 Tax=Camellia sinensis TaxID=4442 RepID=A0A7J7I3J6_CAMSI|nr:hypothetical protein HYC85_000809 [Camellia sinensis]
MKLIVKEVEQVPLGFGLILNTFEEPEEPILSHIRSLSKSLSHRSTPCPPEDKTRGSRTGTTTATGLLKQSMARR